MVLIFLTVNNECRATRLEIINLNKSVIKQTGIVKELQSKKDYHFSEKYISEMIHGIELWRFFLILLIILIIIEMYISNVYVYKNK